MKTIGIFFGTETGTTRLIAKKIQRKLGDEIAAKPLNVNRISVDDMLQYDALILGTPSYGVGAIPGRGAGCQEASWEEFLAKAGTPDFSGKRIAFFGLGAQERYAERFANSLFRLYEVFKGFGADLPVPTQVVMAISDYFVANWYLIFGGMAAAVWFTIYTYKRSTKMQNGIDRLVLRLPVFGDVIRKASIARWCRTLSTMFAAGVPLVESLDSVAGSAGNYVYYEATKRIQSEVSTGTGLTVAMQNTNVFPSMVLQMTAIGEESGALDAMLSKVADFFEAEVDEAVDALASLMEPLIMVVLGGLIGGLVVAMYLPIFKMGSAV